MEDPRATASPCTTTTTFLRRRIPDSAAFEKKSPRPAGRDARDRSPRDEHYRRRAGACGRNSSRQGSGAVSAWRSVNAARGPERAPLGRPALGGGEVVDHREQRPPRGGDVTLGDTIDGDGVDPCGKRDESALEGAAAR